MRRFAILVTTVAAITAGFVGTAGIAAADIATCHEEVPAGTTATLLNDLTCSPASSPAVILNEKSHLNLNGHTISGGQYAVFLLGKKTQIDGPGVITGAGDTAVFRPNAVGKDTVTINNVDITNSPFGVVLGQQNKIRLNLTGVNLHDNAKAAIADCTGLTIVANGVDVRHNADGICASSITLRNSTVQDNTGIGVFNWFGPVRLFASQVDGNGGNNIIPGPVDIASRHKPSLSHGSTCGLSLKMPKWPTLPTGSPSWHSCSGD